MAKQLHRLRIDSQRRIYLDDKPLKGVQALHFKMSTENPALGILNLAMYVESQDIVHDAVEVTQSGPTEPKPEAA